MLKCCKCEDRYETSKIYVKNFCQNSHIPVNENEKKYFVKNALSLKNTVLCVFFQICHENLPAVLPIIGQRNVKSVKTKLYYGPKSQLDDLFTHS